MHFYHQLFHYPTVNGIDGTGMKTIEGSLCIRDSTDVIHKEIVKGDLFLFSRLKVTLPSYAGKG
jgi:hypothetical protein